MTAQTIIANNKTLLLANQPLIMGIVNATPDSFYDKGSFFTKGDSNPTVDRALSLIKEGADIIDVGGETAQPDSPVLSPEEEIKRVVPVIEQLVQKTETVISVDTYKPEVADAALKVGANIVNDTSGLADPELANVAARHNAAMVCMHIPCHPKERLTPGYEDPVSAIIEFWQEKIEIMNASGLSDQQIILDPGIGFGKTTDENLQLIANVKQLKRVGYPILFACSRRTFLGNLMGGQTPDQRLAPTVAVNVEAMKAGVDMIRVHDVSFMRQLREIFALISEKSNSQ